MHISLQIFDIIDISGAFEVECDMSDPEVIITTVHHDSEEPVYVTGYKDPGSYQHVIDYYGVSPTQLRAMGHLSDTCEQYLRVDCFGVGGGVENDWWLNVNGQPVMFKKEGHCTCALSKACFENQTRCAFSHE